MPVANLLRVKGAVHDINEIKVLSDDQCNIRFMSDRTLYILQNLSAEDITFLTRYGTILDNDEYIPVTDASPDFDDVETAIDLVRRDLTDMTSCDIVSAINQLTQAIVATSCGCEVGQGSDTSDGVNGGPIPPPVGDIIYQEPSTVQDRNCKAANLVHQTLLDLFTDLDAYNVDDMGVLGLVVAIGVVTGIIASTILTPMGGIIVGVAGALAAFVAKMIGVTVSLADIVGAMSIRQTDLVCALYSSSSASTAKTAYLDVLSEEIGFGAAERALVDLMMFNAFMNTLFFDTAELASFWPGYTGPVDCSTCLAPIISDIEDVPGFPGAVIIGSDRFLVGDTVVVQTTDDQLCAGRQKAAVEILVGVGQIETTLALGSVSGWSETCAFPCAENNSVIWGDGFDPVRIVWACNVQPATAGQAGSAVVKVESATVTTFSLTRLA